MSTKEFIRPISLVSECLLATLITYSRLNGGEEVSSWKQSDEQREPRALGLLIYHQDKMHVNLFLLWKEKLCELHFTVHKHMETKMNRHFSFLLGKVIH